MEVIIYTPKVSAVKGGDHVGAALYVRHDTAGIPGFSLRVNWGSWEHIQLFGVVKMTSDLDWHVFQFVQFIEAVEKEQDRNENLGYSLGSKSPLVRKKKFCQLMWSFMNESKGKRTN